MPVLGELPQQIPCQNERRCDVLAPGHGSDARIRSATGSFLPKMARNRQRGWPGVVAHRRAGRRDRVIKNDERQLFLNIAFRSPRHPRRLDGTLVVESTAVRGGRPTRPDFHRLPAPAGNPRHRNPEARGPGLEHVPQSCQWDTLDACCRAGPRPNRALPLLPISGERGEGASLGHPGAGRRRTRHPGARSGIP